MIVFEKIRWKNFLSTGNVFTEINLNSDKTSLIIGKNGAGKSTILDALTFSLFGKPFRKINKPMLVNSINEKDCVTEIEFHIGKDQYKIIRGIKPNIFEIYCNNLLWNQESSIIDQQKNLEQNVLKMNYKSFTQIVVLGSSTFVPFMRLPVASRREIIEDILDIQIFSVMSQNLKEKIKISNAEIKDLDYQIDILSEKKEMQKKFIEQSSKKNEEDIILKKQKIDFLSLEKNDLLKKQESLSREIFSTNVLIKKYSDETSKIKFLIQDKGKIENSVTQFMKEHKFFCKNSKCPTCTQEISENIKNDRITSIMSSINDLKIEFTKVQENISRLEKEEEELKNLLAHLNKFTTELEVTYNSISNNESQIIDLKSDIESLKTIKSETDSSRKELERYTNEIEKLKSEFANSKEEMDCLLTASQLLKDNGIKTRIIKKYLPVMNKLISQYLQNMDFYIDFNLDENFEETIKSRYRDIFSYESFSEGEKSRIDIALLLTWRAVAKLKNSVDTNLLILDEIFDGSLDQNGTGELGWILRNFDDKTNVFVISHKENLTDKFDRTIMFEKVKNYSVGSDTTQTV